MLHAIFFFRQALVGIFFQNHPPPPPQELNGRPLRKVRSGALYPGGLQSDVCFDYKRRGLYLGGVGGGLKSGSLCYDPLAKKLAKGSVGLLRPLLSWFYL